MEFQSVTPAFINKENFFPLIIQNRVDIIKNTILYAIKDIACELQIDISKFKLEYYYDTGNEFESGIIRALTTRTDDKKHIYIYIFINTIIDCYNKYPLYYIVHEVIRILAHEMRHVYQFINETHKIGNINQEYIDNYSNIDYEKDAIEFSEKYTEQKTLFILSIYYQCINEIIQSDIDYFTFDIYHFMNHFIINETDTFHKVCYIMNMQYVTEFNSITIIPSYEDSNSCNFNLNDNYDLIISTNIHSRLNTIEDIDDLVYIVTDEICNIIMCINKRVNGDLNTGYNKMQLDMCRNEIMHKVLKYCIRTIY